MDSVQSFMEKKLGKGMNGTWSSCNEMLDRAASTIYSAYASKNLNKQGLQLQSALLEMSTQFYTLHGRQRIADMVHPAIAVWASLSTKCAQCDKDGPLSKSKDSLSELFVNCGSCLFSIWLRRCDVCMRQASKVY